MTGGLTLLTGMFGKWHLGDVYPYRPEDRGFQHGVYHKGGGVGQAPDYWGNDDFDDTYVVDGKLKRFKGFCTDIWFDEGMKFIKANERKPFFAYIALNAPHQPLYCPLKYSEPYENNPQVSYPEFYGMISNIDDNLAKLLAFLDREKLAESVFSHSGFAIFIHPMGADASGFFRKKSNHLDSDSWVNLKYHPV